MTKDAARRSETSVSLSHAQDNFGEIFAQVTRGARVLITRDEKPEAVVLSMDEYNRLVGVEPVDLNALERDFDEMFGRMQESRQREAVDGLLEMGSEDLGNAFAEEVRNRGRSSS